jgi:hypothetical protein
MLSPTWIHITQTLAVSRRDKWFEERPLRPAAEYACNLARDRVWRDEHARLIGTHSDWPDVTYLLGLGETIAHALVLVLSRIPASERLAFAAAFFEARTANDAPSDFQARLEAANRVQCPGDRRRRLALAAEIALLVLDLVESAALKDEAVVDLLRGAAQGDDLTTSPEPAVARLQKAVARVRFDPTFEDESDPHAVASLAAVEVLDPSSDEPAVKELVARAAFATVECRSQPETLDFLLVADRILVGADAMS